MPPVLSEEELGIGDPYVALAIEVSATEKEVRRAYRQLSLKYHPDRNSSQEAVKKFREISLAHEILIDIAKRQYVDTRLEGERKKREKYAEMDKKRKDLVDALNAREEEAKRAKTEAAQRRQYEAEEEAIKEEGRRMLELAQKRAMAASQAQSAQSLSNGASANVSTNGHGSATAAAPVGANKQPPIEPIDLTLLLSVPSSSSLASSSVALQAAIERRYGAVSHVLVPPEKEKLAADGAKKKGKKPRKAVVEFAKGNWGGCWACWKDHHSTTDEAGDAVAGDAAPAASADKRLEAGVKAKWAGGATPAWVEWAERQRHLRPPDAGSGSAGRDTAPKQFSSAPDLSGPGMADVLAQQAKSKERKRQEDEYESMTLLRMRQLERERLAEELRRQEEEEE